MPVSAEHAQRVRARSAAEGEALRADRVTKVFRDGRRKLVAVDDVTIEVVAGETFGLVGESGSGKTTLANCIAGLVATDGGEVRFLGRLSRVGAPPRRCAPSRWSSRTPTPRSTRPGAPAPSSRVPCASSAARGRRRGAAEELAWQVDFEPRYLENRPGELGRAETARGDRACLRRAAGAGRL
jgi:peptide/nickel transport system ATP-binding protein